MWKSLKRWPVLLALLVALGALAVGLVCLPHGSRVTRANFERIQKGMTSDEVYAILGEPRNDGLLDPESPSNNAVASFLLHAEELFAYQYWVGPDLVLFVAYNHDGRVTEVDLVPDDDRPRTTLPGRVWPRLRERYGW